MRKWLIVVLVTLGILLAGCGGQDGFGNQTTRDLEGVKMNEPYAVRAYINADEFPNLELYCVTENGPTWLITTREYHQPQQYAETCVIGEGTGRD